MTGRLSHLLARPVPDGSWTVKPLSNWITISYGVNDDGGRELPGGVTRHQRESTVRRLWRPAAKSPRRSRLPREPGPRHAADNDRGLDFNAVRCSAAWLNVAQSGPGIYDIRFNAL